MRKFIIMSLALFAFALVACDFGDKDKDKDSDKGAGETDVVEGDNLVLSVPQGMADTTIAVDVVSGDMKQSVTLGGCVNVDSSLLSSLVVSVGEVKVCDNTDEKVANCSGGFYTLYTTTEGAFGLASVPVEEKECVDLVTSTSVMVGTPEASTATTTTDTVEEEESTTPTGN